MNQIHAGLDVLLSDPKVFIKGKNVGLLVNQTSIASDGQHSISHFRQFSDFELVKLFAPEHGLYGTEQDMTEVTESTDPISGLPVASLYGKSQESLVPNSAALEGIDTLIYDIQDVGARYYTFANTLANCMRVCGETETAIVVCDRPNPINGVQVEGNLVDELQRSFVGKFPIPNRHGMTTGELARLFWNHFDVECDLNVVPMEGWNREMWQDQTELPWIAPSPNMPTLDTATVYPGMCLLEGTHLSEGRGTTQPFEFCGAPYIDPHVLARNLNDKDLPGVYFRPHYFKPSFQKWAGQLCGGVQTHVIDGSTFKPVLTGVAVILAVAREYPGQFQWRSEPYEFVSDRPAIDLLYGNSQLRKKFVKGSQSLEEIEGTWRNGLESFLDVRREYLFY